MIFALLLAQGEGIVVLFTALVVEEEDEISNPLLLLLLVLLHICGDGCEDGVHGVALLLGTKLLFRRTLGVRANEEAGERG